MFLNERRTRHNEMNNVFPHRSKSLLNTGKSKFMIFDLDRKL